MAMNVEWRTNGRVDAILVVDDDENTVREALPASAARLSKFLTDMEGLDTWRGEHPIEDNRRDPATWGALVIARDATGEVITMDPERFWDGIYTWFRSRGVDYNTPGAY